MGRWSRFAPHVCAGILLVAAGLKAYELVTDPALGRPYGSRWLQLLLIEYEVLLATWLLVGVAPTIVRRVALATFAAFAGYALYLGFTGAASCGCFGRAQVNPWWTFAMDCAALLFLWRWTPAKEVPAAESANRDDGASCWRFRSIKYLVPLVLVVLLTALAYRYEVHSPSISDGPRQVLHLEHDFHVLAPMSVTTCEVPIVNSSSQTWSVESIRSACSCTVQQLEPRTILPSTTGRLNVTFRAPDLRGPFSRDLVVQFREADAPIAIVRLQGIIRRWAESRPAVIDWDTLSPGATRALQFDIAAYEATDIRVSKSGPDWVLLAPRATSTESTASTDTPVVIVSTFCLTINPPKDLSPGSYGGAVTVKDIRSERTIEIPYRGRVVSPVSADHEQIFFGFVAPGAKASRMVRLHLLESLARSAIDSVSTEHSLGSELIISVHSTDDPSEVVLDASYSASTEVGPRLGHVEIRVNGNPVLALPVHAFVRDCAE